MNIQFDLVVTRHPHLVTVLRERGLITSETPVLEHVDAPEQVDGKHVIGVLPHHLSSRAASITEIPMRWTLDDRKAMLSGDIEIDATRRAAGDPITYVVRAIERGGIDKSRPRWLAWASALAFVERLGTHFGAGPHQHQADGASFRGLPVILIYDATHGVQAEVIESRGVWRPHRKGPWLDGYGREVDADSITPASGWVPSDD